MPEQNLLRFQESVNKELEVTKDRVRDLIGSANWGEEGRYKEAILRKVISQFLPSNLHLGTGFILAKNDNSSGEQGSMVSRQLDLIVYEGKTPLIFREGDFVILTEDAVRAVIEVKTKVTNFSERNSSALNKIAEKLNRLREFQSFAPTLHRRKKFVGIFSYDYSDSFMHQRVEDMLRNSDGLINHISLGPHKFIRYWEDTKGLNPPVNYDGRCYIRYNLQDLSFSYFISNLLHIVADEEPIQRYWFSFPIVGTKEQYRQEPIIELDN